GKFHPPEIPIAAVAKTTSSSQDGLWLSFLANQEKPMPTLNTITPCLWFDHQAEEAAKFYTGVFKNSKISQITRYSEAGKEFHHREPGSVLTVAFELDGQSFTALNGGPIFKFNEAVSFQVMCQTQQEVDYFWDKLSAGGDKNAQ